MNTSAKSAKILVATKNEFWSSIKASLAGYELVFAPSLKDAKALMTSDHFDLLLVGVFFDESKGVELITDVRLHILELKTPIVVARLKDSANNEMLGEVLKAFVQAKLADEYIVDVQHTDKIQKKLRKAVEKHLPVDKIAPLLCLFQICFNDINQHLSSF